VKKDMSKYLAAKLEMFELLYTIPCSLMTHMLMQLKVYSCIGQLWNLHSN